jgi:hypothetical protein
MEFNMDIVPILIVGIGVILAITAVVLGVAAKRRKKEMDSCKHSDFAGFKTQPNTTGIHIGAGKDWFIRINNADNAGQMWEKSLMTDIRIGRDVGCSIHLTDKSVSRSHCRIYANGFALIENLSKTNTTNLNGMKLIIPTALNLGDKIECGRVTLTVNSLYQRTTPDEKALDGTVIINV